MPLTFSNIFLPVLFIILIHILLFQFKLKIFFKKTNNSKRWSEDQAYLIGGFIFIIFFCFFYTLTYFDITNFFLNIYDLTILIIFYLIGFYDDRFNLNGKIKLVLYFFIIIGLAFYYLDNLSNLNIFLISLILFCIFISLNIIDNMDGIFPFYFFIFLSYFIILNFDNNLLSIFGLYPILIINLYFLFINIFMGKNYLGDSGSYLLSGFIIILFLKYRNNLDIDQTIFLDSIILLNLFAYPIYDFFFVSLKRIYNKKSPLAGGTDHTSHVI